MSASPQASGSKAKMELNPRGIPRAPFIENVEEHLGGPDADSAPALQQLNDTNMKYRYMQMSHQQRKKSLLVKLPDIEQTLQVVRFLQARRKKAAGEPIEEVKGEDEDDLDDLDEEDEADKKEEGPLKTLFELNDTLYAEAEVDETGEVGLWLGANTMLRYPLQEAIDLLQGRLDAAKKSLEEIVEDLEFLQEQITVMDVNYARIHNWDVKRRKTKEKAQKSGILPSSSKDDLD